MNLLKTLGIAVFVAAVTAASVVWYVDYKITKAAEAVMAPIHQTTDAIDETIGDIGETVDSATQTFGSVYSDARDRVALDIESTRSELEEEWELTKELTADLADWFTSLDT